ncbi:ABC-type bacteriocin/lantibiotic exporter with double-glycine peptidase domain [Lewinella marina]|uniref:ABC transporter ATP-binding protein/permease n=1 Tax=Neolewinella marina TaxID=438751 RepID=A0A2G0CCR6_9BACT|nr:ATP-binding cassette domain-containing protein [Neolewinella marina]NJB87556.1 ABC-type bacteriocin/lantibiotic exporter with double-glycine peptidase domain [Neolewinella marina]PHK97752.1 ABC transporter ATP-binding protein/permease [Neolewinella marina]
MAVTQSDLSPLERFWRLLKPDRREVRNVWVYALFAGLVNLSLPLGIQAIVNLIMGGRPSSAWLVLVCLVVFGIAAIGVLQIQQMRVVENLQQKIFSRAAFEFAYRIPRVRTDVIYNYYGPELMNRFFDVLTVQKGLSKILIDFSVASLQVVFGLMLLSVYHPFFILFGIILVGLVTLIFVFTARRGLATSLQESKHKYAAVHWLEELARTASSFKMAGKSNMALQRMDRHVDDYLDARESHFNILIRQYGLLVVFKVIVALGLLAIGGLLVMQERMNIGQFVAAEIIILFVMASVEKLILSLETIYDVLTGLEKIGQVTDLELDNKTDGSPVELMQSEAGLAIRLENVTFKYPNAPEAILNQLEFYAKSGERVMITGPSGSGKSTLLYLIAGLYDIRKGSLSYNGLPRNNLGLEALHSIIGTCFKQGELFEGTVLENITMGRERATFQNVEWAVENLGLSSTIRNLPLGFETKLNPTGDKLSRSIVQRLLLARAIADRPRLLLLEHSFEAIDQDGRHEIIDFLLDRSHPWTLIAASSNKYLATLCDRMITLEKGRVAADLTN